MNNRRDPPLIRSELENGVDSIMFRWKRGIDEGRYSKTMKDQG